MGASGNNNQGEVEWGNVTLSDPNCVRGLLRCRMKFDPQYNRDSGNVFDSGFDLCDYKEEIHLLYIDLDRAINIMFEQDKKENKKKQGKSKKLTTRAKILDLFQKGFKESEIAEELGFARSTVIEYLDRICIRISEVNHDLWLESVKKNYKL